MIFFSPETIVSMIIGIFLGAIFMLAVALNLDVRSKISDFEVKLQKIESKVELYIQPKKKG